MGTEIIQTQPLSKSLGSHELKKHRALIAVELEVLAKKFDRFGWDRDRGSVIHDRLLSDWMGALQDCSLEEVQSACSRAVLDNPNRMPNEGHILNLVNRIRLGGGEILSPERQRLRKIIAANGGG